MSLQSDAEILANVQVGGTKRSALVYNDATNTWYVKNQAGVTSPLVNGVSTVDGMNGDVDLTTVYQPVDSDLTAIAALSTTSYGRALLTLADASANTAILNLATSSLKGLMSPTDKSRSDNCYDIEVFNVLDHGISPANSGTTNVTAWNSLMSTIADNGTVFFPPGPSPYDFASVCAIPSGKHLRILGGGQQKSIIRTTSATANIFTVGDWYNEFECLKFTSSVTRTAGAAILSGDNVAINVRSCGFHQMWDGIVYQGGVNSGNLAIVKDCSFTETISRSIVIDGTNANSIITECVGDGTAGLADAHVEINACGSLLMSDCDWIRAVNNLKLNPDSGTKGVFSVYCSNIFFDTASGSAVKYMGAGSTNIQRSKYVNCWFSGSVTGIEFASTATTLPTAIDFVNCDIYSNSAFGVLATAVQDFSMSNCRVAGNATAGVRTNASAGAVTKFTLQNNTIAPTAGIGANGIGIDIVAGTYGGYIVSGNIVINNTSNLNIIDAGTTATTDLRQVTDNVGHLLQGNIADNRGAVTVGVGETLLFNARIPANSVVVGSTIKFSVYGQTSGAGTLIFRCRVGAAGTVADAGVLSLTTTTAAQVANGWQKYEGSIRVVSIGGAGTATGYGSVLAGALLLGEAAAAEVLGTIVTTAPWFIDITCACAAAGTFTVRHGVIEAL